MVNQQRQILGFPHCGRVFLCDDTLGIVDVWQAVDAYKFALSNGVKFTNQSSAAFNVGNPFTFGNLNGNIATMPTTGIDGGYIQGTTDIPAPAFVNGSYLNYACGELHQECRGYAVNATIRILNADEYARTGPFVYGNQYGGGWRAQRVTIVLNNLAAGGANSVTLLDVFADFAYYAANIGGLGTTTINSPWVIDLYAQPYGMTVGQILNIVAIGQLPAIMMRARSCQASMSWRYDFQRDPSGATWGTNLVPQYGALTATFRFEDLQNPLTGKMMNGAGVLGIGLNTFHDGQAYTPTGVAGGTGGSRVATSYPNGFVPAMGDTADALMFVNLQQSARAAFNASWTSISISGRVYAGVYKPIVGNSGRFFDSAIEFMECYIQVPPQCTGFVLIAMVRTIAGVGTHRVKADLTNAAGSFTQTMMNTTQTSGTGDRYVYVNGTLNNLMANISGNVQAYKLRLEATKSAPRVPEQITPFLSDGIKAFYLAFYA